MGTRLWKTTGVVLTYAAYYAALYPYGLLGVVIALFCASAFNAVILLACGSNMRLIGLALVRSLVGAILGAVFLGQLILYNVYLYDHGFGEADKSAIAGAVIGVFIAQVAPWLLSCLRSSRLNPYNE